MEYAGIHRRCHPNLKEDSQIFVAFTTYSDLIMNIEIERGIRVLELNFQKCDCDKFFRTQKLPGGR